MPFSLSVPVPTQAPFQAPMGAGIPTGAGPLLINPCPPGYRLVNVEGQWVCAPVDLSQGAGMFQLSIGGDGGSMGGHSGHFMTREPTTHLP